jgi:hypothetical protein
MGVCSEEMVERAELSFLAPARDQLFSKLRAARRSSNHSMKIILLEARTMSAPARTMRAPAHLH